MVSAFDPKKGTWQIDWPGRVARHDLVYQTPPTEPMQGLPIGNGEIGVLAWCEGSKVIFALNKSDLWDDAGFERFHNWSAKEEEFSTTLRHAARIILDFKLPIFDVFYLSDFNGRLSLADGEIRLGVEGPFGKAKIKAFVDHATGMFCCEVESLFTEDVELDLRLERFGSRTFSHWYSLVNRDAKLGLGGTKSGCDKKDIYLTHELTSGTFAAAVRVLEAEGVKFRSGVEHSRSVCFSFAGAKRRRFSFAAVVTLPVTLSGASSVTSPVTSSVMLPAASPVGGRGCCDESDNAGGRGCCEESRNIGGSGCSGENGNAGGRGCSGENGNIGGVNGGDSSDAGGANRCGGSSYKRGGSGLVANDGSRYHCRGDAGVCGSDGSEEKNAVLLAKGQLDGVEKIGLAKVSKAHRAAWKEFWMRSMMEFGDEYIDSLWHVTMFYAAASQRGKYPGRFINSLWNWNRDVQNWNFYFHWNQQQVYWPLNAAGHHDLIDSYLNYRFNSLPYAKKDATEVMKSQGAIVSDVCERRGCNSASEFHNHTPVAQIAMEFWRQYKYTGDREFLTAKALPYIREAAYFFESLFEKGKDGKYHAKEGTGYEGWILLHDCVSELVYAKVLFSTAIEALKEAGEEDAHAGQWREILENLVELPSVKADKGFVQKGKLNRGWFKGDKATSDRLLAAGFGVNAKKWMTSFLSETPAGPSSEELFELTNMQEGKPALPDKYRDDIRCNDGIFPWVEYSAVFPSGLVGLGQKGTNLYKMTVNTVKAFSCPGMGWFPLGITLARLGLGTEARKIINAWPMLWQYYCNGWGHYGPLAIMKGESSVVHRMNRVVDASMPDDRREKERFAFELYPFRHMGMESMSVFATAVNESLLQSQDGVIRVGPAIVGDQNARFTLHACDGFVVSSEIENGKARWIGIESKLGKNCKVANPWAKAVVFENGKKIETFTGKTFEFVTKVGKHYLIVPDEKVMKNWKTVCVKYVQNDKAKTHFSGYATLGLPRMF